MPEPVTLAEAKAQVRVLHDDEDALISALIIAAREWVENFTGHILVKRDVVQYFDSFARPRLFTWPIADDATVTIDYRDSTGDWQTVPGVRIIQSNGWASIAPAVNATWPSILYGPARVALEAGYATPDDVPQSMKQAILLLVGTWYAGREASSDKPMTEVPFAVDALCRPHRLVLI